MRPVVNASMFGREQTSQDCHSERSRGISCHATIGRPAALWHNVPGLPPLRQERDSSTALGMTIKKCMYKPNPAGAGDRNVRLSAGNENPLKNALVV